jgi:branched-chain amino acid transport system ATP-binding protein
MNQPMLAIERLTLRFGGLTAVNSVSFTVAPGEILAVIGPNGAGKTSLFNAITGVYPPTEGQVLIDGAEVIEPFRPRLLAQWAALGLATGFGVLLATQAQEMWQAAVVDLYLPNRAFPWGQACRQALGALVPGTWSLLPVLIGLGFGTAAGWRLWLGTRRGAERVARAGVGRTFQNIRLFGDLTCRDNVLIGMHSRLRAAWYDAAFRLLRHRSEEPRARATAMELLRFVGLEDVAERPAGVLPYGHQRRLEIARALALEPGLLLLDEPAAGMNPTESQELMALIRRIRETGTTCLLIEHDMTVVMGVSDRIVVLHYGTKIAEGTPAEIRSNPEVVEAYLGAEDSGRFPIPKTDRVARETTRRESKS